MYPNPRRLPLNISPCCGFCWTVTRKVLEFHGSLVLLHHYSPSDWKSGSAISVTSSALPERGCGWVCLVSLPWCLGPPLLWPCRLPLCLCFPIFAHMPVVAIFEASWAETLVMIRAAWLCHYYVGSRRDLKQSTQFLKACFRKNGELRMFVRPPSHAEALGPGSAGPSLAIPYANSLDQVPRAAAQLPEGGNGAPFAVDPAAVAGARDDRTHTQ